MLILFDRHCHADIHCDSLQKEFVKNTEIDLLSPHFHMVNLMGIQEHNQHFDDMVTSPWYLPRIFFLEDNVSSEAVSKLLVLGRYNQMGSQSATQR